MPTKPWRCKTCGAITMGGKASACQCDPRLQRGPRPLPHRLTIHASLLVEDTSAKSDELLAALEELGVFVDVASFELMADDDAIPGSPLDEAIRETRRRQRAARA